MASDDIDRILTPEIWGKLIGIHLKEYQTPMRHLLLDLGNSHELSLGTKIPIIFNDQVSVNNRGTLGSAIHFPFPKQEKSYLDINQNKYASLMVPDEIRSTITKNYINSCTKEIALALNNAFEKDLLKEVKTSAKMSFTLPALNASSVKQIIIQAKKTMNKASIPENNRWLVLDNDTFALIEDWLTTIPFAQADNVLKTGKVFSLYGLNISLSSFADGIYFGHKNGLVHASSLESFESSKDINTKSTKMVGQMVYGMHSPNSGAWLGKIEIAKKGA